MYVNSDWNIFPDVDGWIWPLWLSGLSTETHSLPSTCPAWVKESVPQVRFAHWLGFRVEVDMGGPRIALHSCFLMPSLPWESMSHGWRKLGIL